MPQMRDSSAVVTPRQPKSRFNQRPQSAPGVSRAQRRRTDIKEEKHDSIRVAIRVRPYTAQVHAS